jgi:hypothetical protein
VNDSPKEHDAERKKQSVPVLEAYASWLKQQRSRTIQELVVAVDYRLRTNTFTVTCRLQLYDSVIGMRTAGFIFGQRTVPRVETSSGPGLEVR